MMDKINISAVSYLNTRVFIYGLQKTNIRNKINLSLDIPSECSRKLEENEIDIGLTPVISLLKVQNPTIVSDYCIGANNVVKSVLLAGNSSIHDLKRIYLDKHSKTSVILARILAKKYWKITPEFIPFSNGKNYFSLEKNEAAVIIGDKTFDLFDHFEYKYDLALEWIKFTGLPFVFAAWISNKKIPKEFITEFNTALQYGLDHMDQLVSMIEKEKIFSIDIKNYLTQNISFILDAKKKEGMNLFLKYVKELE